MSTTIQRPRFDAAALPQTVAPRERLLSLDVFRGLTIAGMLLVNNPGSWSASYPPLRHAAWHGWTPTDLIFPFFLFIVGITTYLSVGARRERGDSERAIIAQILKRGVIIFLLGMLLSGFPFFDLSTIRVPGVLQRIAVVYVLTALLTLRTTLTQQIAIIAALLYGYWFLMTLVPVPGRGLGALFLDEPSATLAAWIDRLLLDGHLWKATGTWDPEGILSTIPAVGTAMLGVCAGQWLARRLPLPERIAALFAVGSIGSVAGLMWGWSFPINKNLWTSSYVLFTAGMACAVLATCMWLIDYQRITWWTKPFVVFGVNPIAAFVGSGLLARLIYSVIKVPYEGEHVALQTALYKAAFASWLPPRDASLAFALCTVLFWLAVMWLLYRRKIFLRV
jgi:predicted acyltransferase